MNENPLQTIANRVGFAAYMFVMSGGRPDWPALLGQGGFAQLDSRAREIEAEHPLLDTVPVEVAQERERATAAGY